MSGEKVEEKDLNQEAVEVEEVETPEETDETPPETDEEESSEEEGEEESEGEETPFWLQDEDAEEEPDSSEAVPEAALINAKKKLKGKIKERDEEIEKLRKENELLKQGQPASHQQPQEPPKRPRMADFDTDEEYEDAMDKYEADKLVWQTQQVQSTNTAKAQLEQHKQKVAKAVDGHYERAAKLVSEAGISQDVYKQADTTLRQTIEEVLPGQGDSIFDWLTSVVGEGSEKTLFYVGRNKAALTEFKGLLSSDRSGLAAAFHLGKITERISGPKKQQSRAPKPAPRAKGDLGVNSKEKAASKKYKEAHKAGDAQKAYEIKKQAKKDGIDVSKWS